MHRVLLIVCVLPFVPMLHAIPITLKPPAGSPQQKVQIDISGTADGKLANYKGAVWLVANQDVQLLQVIPSTLTSADARSIPINAIHVNSIALQTGIAKELDISIDASVLPGMFIGNLQLIGPKGEPVDPIPVTLGLTSKPNLVVAPASFAFTLSRCFSKVTCSIDDFVLPPSLVGDSRPWQLENQTPSDVKWTTASLTLRGEKTGTFVNDNHITLLTNTKPPSEPIWPISLFGKDGVSAPMLFRFDRREIQPDHYQGQYRVQFVGSDPMVIPFTLDVRDGPLLPMLVLLVGIVAGRFVQSTNAPRFQSQMHLMDLYKIVPAEVDLIAYVPIEQSLRLRLNQVLVDIRTLAQPEADLTTQLNAILRLASDARKLDQVEPKIKAVTNPAQQAALLTLLAAARTAISVADVSTAERDLSSINNSLSTGQLPVQGPAARLAAPLAPAPKPNLLIKMICFLAGSTPISTDWFFQWGRPLMFLLLLILLLFVGLYNSYIRNATFGVESYFDYLSLFMWGLSADVAQRTLQNLSLNRT